MQELLDLGTTTARRCTSATSSSGGILSLGGVVPHGEAPAHLIRRLVRTRSRNRTSRRQTTPPTPTSSRHHHRLRPGRPDGGHLHAPAPTSRPLVIEGEPSSHARPARRAADAHHRRRELPGFPDGIMGPELMLELPRAGRALRRRVPHREGHHGRPLRAPVPGLGPRPPSSHGRRRHRLDRRPVADARARGRDEAARPRPVDVRHLRRLLLPRPRHRRRRRRRLGGRGGDVPHQVRRQGHPRSTAATQLRASQDHAGPGASPTRRSSSSGTPSSTISSASDTVEGAVVRNVHTDGRRRRCRSPGVFVAIGHRPNTDLFKGLLDMDDNGYLVTAAGLDVHERRRACSPAATSRTTPTARRSPPPARAAWRRSTPSAGSKPRHH